jgi:hypothetical protein
VVVEPEIAPAVIAEPEAIKTQAPEPRQRAARRVTKVDAPEAPAKKRPAKKPAGAGEPFGEHTPAFMLRPVNVA